MTEFARQVAHAQRRLDWLAAQPGGPDALVTVRCSTGYLYWSRAELALLLHHAIYDRAWNAKHQEVGR